jgi:hypothetical protein
MADPSRMPPSGSRGWRARPKEELPSKGAKRTKLAILSVLLLGLAVLLVCILLPSTVPPVRFLALPIIDYDVLAVPPLPFVKEDADALVDLAPDGEVLRKLETWEGISGLGKWLQDTIGDRDALVLYVAGHGVSQSGTAYLLCSDYLRGKQGTGNYAPYARYAVDQLLDQVHQCRARVKLLILDADHLASAPRLGMAVNDFSRLVEEKVKAVRDPNLWVLMASQPLEPSLASYRTTRSVFSYYVTKGLASADFDPRDEKVDLAELVSYVSLGVKEYAQQEGTQQAPLFVRLLRGTKGEVRQADHVVLCRRAPDAKEAEPQADAVGKSSGEKTSASPTARPTKEDAAKEQWYKLVGDAWTLRQQIQDRSKAVPWSPIDYAPHLWRKLDALLLGGESRYGSGTAYAKEELTKEFRDMVGSLQELKKIEEKEEIAATDREVSASASPGSDVIVRVAAARREFLRCLNRAGWRDGPESPDQATARALVQLKNDLLFHLPSYLRWRACLAQASSAPTAIDASLEGLLGQLPGFLDLLDRLDKGKMDEQDAAGRQAKWTDTVARLKEKAKTLQDWRDRIEKELKIAKGWERDFDDLVANAGKEGNTAKIEGLLATALPSASQRIKLLKGLDAAARSVAPPPLPTKLQLTGLPEGEPSVAQWRQDRLRRSVQFEIDLARLAGVRLADAPVAPVDRGGAEWQDFWTKYEELGERLGKFYQDLPEGINGAIVRGGSGQTTSLAQADRLLRLVDARDSDRIAAGATLLAFRPPWTPARSVSGQKTAPTTPKPTGPDQVDLVVHRLISPEGAMTDQWIDKLEGDGLRLRPFPNRVTSYRLELVNRSGRKRNVDVELLAATGSRGRGPADWQHPWDPKTGKLRPGFQQLAAPVNLELPDGDAPTTIPFVAPKTPAPSKDAGPSESAKGKSAERLAAEGVSVVEGIVCAVRDSASKSELGVRRIELRPLRPHDYLFPEVGYNKDQGKITIDLRRAREELDCLPPYSKEAPLAASLKLVWPAEESPGADALAKDVRYPGKYEAMIGSSDKIPPADGVAAAERAEPALFADVATDPRRTVEVQLTVDRYPRAFLYEVRFDRNRSKIERERGTCRVAILQPPQNNPYRVPGEEPVMVDFQADAPDDAFPDKRDALEKSDERLELRIFDADQPRDLCPEEARQFFNDRQVDVRLTGLEPQGVLNIRTEVSDFFKVALRRPGLENIRAKIHLQLHLPDLRESQLRWAVLKDDVTVVFDGTAPQVEEITIEGKSVIQGEPVTASFSATDDLSGIKEVLYGFDLDQSGELEAGENPKKLLQPDTDGRWRFSLPTKERDPGRYVVMVRVTDRVGLSTTRMKSVEIKPKPPEGPAATTFSLEGRVVSQAGRPVADVEVRLEGTVYKTTTDAAGQFAFQNLPGGEYILVAKGSYQGHAVSTKTPLRVILPIPGGQAKVEIPVEW